MEFKRKVLVGFLISVVIVAGLGMAQKAYSAHQSDGPDLQPKNESYSSSSETALQQQLKGMFGIVLGGLAILLIIFSGVGFHYKNQSKEPQTPESPQPPHTP